MNSTFTQYTPMDQFEIIDYLNIELLGNNNIIPSFTNIVLYIILSWIILVNSSILMNTKTISPNGWSIFLESIYDTIYGIVYRQVETKKSYLYFPLMYTLFTFVLINNLIGLIPYSFTTTSHFLLTFSLSFNIVISSTLLGLMRRGIKFFSIFVPGGCPLILIPLLVLIEFISYLARNVSLGLRLAANILAGHMLLNILSGFIYILITSRVIYFMLGIISISIVLCFSCLELCIAFIQAQVFVVLTSSYIKDGVR